MKNPLPTDVAAVFDAYPSKHRRKLLAIRKLIFEVAKSFDGVGPLEETLKWGEPAYLPSHTKSGTTIRIDWKPKQPQQYAMYFHCQTDLVQRFRAQFPDDFQFDGNRAILFDADQPIPIQPLSRCIAAALTYHLDKRS